MGDLAHEMISEVIDVHEIVFARSLANIETEVEISLTRRGTVHAVLYWFDIGYSDDHTINTLTSESYDAAAILLPAPIEAQNPAHVITCQFMLEDGLLDLKIASE